MDWKDVGKKIVDILGPASTIAAPFLSLVPGGALIPSAVTAINAIASALGIKEPNPTPDAVMTAIQANPQAAAELAKAQLQYNHELAMRQIETEEKSRGDQAAINLQDAKDLRWWNSGWRPYIGWVCGTALLAYYIPQSIMATTLWVISIYKHGWELVPYPNTFDMSELIALLVSILGLGGLKTFEKKTGVSK